MKLKVDGITCSGCADDVASAMKKYDGVINADASYSTGDLNVEYDPGEIDENKVLDLIKKLGLKNIS